MVLSPKRRKMFLVDVKGLYRKNAWIVKRKTERKDLFYVLVYVPPKEPNEFFVMTQRQIKRHIEDELTRLKRPNHYPVEGFLWKLALPYRNAWSVLPE